jgi:hypothetical protein
VAGLRDYRKANVQQTSEAQKEAEELPGDQPEEETRDENWEEFWSAVRMVQASAKKMAALEGREAGSGSKAKQE